MKFEYIGSDGYRDLDLVIYKIMDKRDVMVKGTVIDVPDELTELIRRIKINGNYREVIPKISTKKSKKRNKRRY